MQILNDLLAFLPWDKTAFRQDERSEKGKVDRESSVSRDLNSGCPKHNSITSEHCPKGYWQQQCMIMFRVLHILYMFEVFIQPQCIGSAGQSEQPVFFLKGRAL